MRSEFIAEVPQIVFLSFVTHTAIQTVGKENEYRHAALFCHNKNPRDLNVKLSSAVYSYSENESVYQIYWIWGQLKERH